MFNFLWQTSKIIPPLLFIWLTISAFLKKKSWTSSLAFLTKCQILSPQCLQLFVDYFIWLLKLFFQNFPYIFCFSNSKNSRIDGFAYSLLDYPKDFSISFHILHVLFLFCFYPTWRSSYLRTFFIPYFNWIPQI